MRRSPLAPHGYLLKKKYGASLVAAITRGQPDTPL